MRNIKYIIITPVRDEGKYIESTIKSVISQTVRPKKWVIVNDGSTDNTGDIIDKYVNIYPWIIVIHRTNRGFRKSGGGVIEAFYDGFRLIENEDWEYIVKLDGDLEFNGNYFEKCLYEFETNEIYGLCGGTIFNREGENNYIEKTPSFHVRGATKIYRRECWNSIGGLIVAPGWDTVDEVKANMLGWVTKSFPDIYLYQLKMTGAGDGQLRDKIKHGRANFIAGYHPLFMVIKGIRRLFNKPYILGSICMLYGYFSCSFKNIKKVDDEELVKYVRSQQVRKLLLLDTIWK